MCFEESFASLFLNSPYEALFLLVHRKLDINDNCYCYQFEDVYVLYTSCTIYIFSYISTIQEFYTLHFVMDYILSTVGFVVYYHHSYEPQVNFIKSKDIEISWFGNASCEWSCGYVAFAILLVLFPKEDININLEWVWVHMFENVLCLTRSGVFVVGY